MHGIWVKGEVSLRHSARPAISIPVHNHPTHPLQPLHLVTKPGLRAEGKLHARGLPLR